MSVCLSIHPFTWNNLASTGHILMKFDTTVFFEKLSIEFKFHENLTRIMGTLHEDLCTLWYLTQFVIELKMFQTKVVEKIKTHILCSVTFLLKSCHL